MRILPWRDSCPAKTRAIPTLAQVRSLPVIQVTRETAGEVYQRNRSLPRPARRRGEGVKELCPVSGPVPLPDGREPWAVEEDAGERVRRRCAGRCLGRKVRPEEAITEASR